MGSFVLDRRLLRGGRCLECSFDVVLIESCFKLFTSVWQNLAFEDRIQMASQGDFRNLKALLTNQELRLKTTSTNR